jgi:hypothetical protein
MANGLFGGGNGTSAAPYLVEDVADLNAVRNYVANPGAYFKQTKDISMSISPYNVSPGFDPIGPEANSSASQAYIYYDGNNFNISGLLIDRTGYVALFRYVYGWLKNIKIVDCNVKGTQAAALCHNIVGNVGVDNCHATGIVTGIEKAGGLIVRVSQSVTNSTFDGQVSALWVGGFAAEISIAYLGGVDSGAITDCVSSGTVIGGYFGGPMPSAPDDRLNIHAGGFIGRPMRGNITRCKSYSNVSGTQFYSYENYFGGFFGRGSSCFINCVSFGTVQWSNSTSSTAKLGGFGAYIGVQPAPQVNNVAPYIKQCVAHGNVNSPNSPVAGFIFELSDSRKVQITECFTESNLIGSSAYGFTHGWWNGLGALVDLVGNSFIHDCYSRSKIGPMTGPVRGFVNTDYIYNQYIHISNCYFAGTVDTTSADKAGIINSAPNGWIVFDGNCYWDTQLSGILTSGGGAKAVGKTTAEMQTQATFVGFDFSTLWMILPNDYPLLVWAYDPGPASYLTNTTQLVLIKTIDISNGMIDAGKVISTNLYGKLNSTMIYADTVSKPAAKPSVYLVLRVINGENKWAIEHAVSVSSGVSDNGKIICLNADGKIDFSMMPLTGDVSPASQSANISYMTMKNKQLQSVRDAVDVSTGKPSAGKIVCLNANGRIDPSLIS